VKPSCLKPEDKAISQRAMVCPPQDKAISQRAMVCPPQDKAIMKQIYRIALENKIKLYLVGGYLRDIFLCRQKENPDIDFCIDKNAISFGRKVAGKLRAGFVVLDRAHGTSRAVKKVKGKFYTLDFTDRRGKTLNDDLRHRDFTVNSFALELSEIFKNKNEVSLIDPYAGIKDLKSKTIRIVNKKAFDEDPLRILRAFSLAAIFDFGIEKETLRLSSQKRKKLSAVSFERIREELFKILGTADAFKYFSLMDNLGILEIVMPEINITRNVQQGPYHHLDVWQHSLETLRQLEIALKGLTRNKDIRGYLNEIISAQRRRLGLVKLGALLHDIGKPQAMRREEGKIKFHGHERAGLYLAEEIALRLKLSNDEIEALKKMVLWHLRPGYLADSEDLSDRAIFRYLRDTGNEAVSTLLISLADQRATKGPLTSEESRAQHEKLVAYLLKEYFRRKKEKKLPRLLGGDDLIKKFNLAPSPLIGKILSELEELQAIGKIKTKKEALAAVKGILKEGKK